MRPRYPLGSNYEQAQYQTVASVSKHRRVTVPKVYEAIVLRVVDGDTIVVDLGDGEKTKVRLIGVDTPETVHPRKPVECYGPEASAFLKQLLPPGSTVFLSYEEGNKLDHYSLLYLPPSPSINDFLERVFPKEPANIFRNDFSSWLTSTNVSVM